VGLTSALCWSMSSLADSASGTAHCESARPTIASLRAGSPAQAGRHGGAARAHRHAQARERARQRRHGPDAVGVALRRGQHERGDRLRVRQRKVDCDGAPQAGPQQHHRPAHLRGPPRRPRPRCSAAAPVRGATAVRRCFGHACRGARTALRCCMGTHTVQQPTGWTRRWQSYENAEVTRPVVRGSARPAICMHMRSRPARSRRSQAGSGPWPSRRRTGARASARGRAARPAARQSRSR